MSKPHCNTFWPQNSSENSELLFLFGKASTPNHKFKAELTKHGDFVIGNFTDSYQHLPLKKGFQLPHSISDPFKLKVKNLLKTLSGYTYLNKYCSNQYPKWIVFQDDDTFVDSPKLARFLETKWSDRTQFFCPRRIASPDRTGHQSNLKGHELVVNESIWDLAYYPVYCAGPCTIMSAPTASAIYSTALKTNWRRFPVEDVLFTGIIRNKASLPQPPCCFDHKAYCTHYNKLTKYEDLKSRVEDYTNGL